MSDIPALPKRVLEQSVTLDVEDTRKYLQAELDVLESVKSYDIIYDYGTCLAPS